MKALVTPLNTDSIRKLRLTRILCIISPLPSFHLSTLFSPTYCRLTAHHSIGVYVLPDSFASSLEQGVSPSARFSTYLSGPHSASHFCRTCENLRAYESIPASTASSSQTLIFARVQIILALSNFVTQFSK